MYRPESKVQTENIINGYTEPGNPIKVVSNKQGYEVAWRSHGITGESAQGLIDQFFACLPNQDPSSRLAEVDFQEDPEGFIIRSSVNLAPVIGNLIESKRNGFVPSVEIPLTERLDVLLHKYPGIE